MSFSDFFQANVIMFIAFFGVLAYIVFLELKGVKMKGKTLSTLELTRAVNDGALLLDVRAKEDFLKGHIAGAKSIPLNVLSTHLNENEIGKTDREIVAYCYSGKSSVGAVSMLVDAGYTKAKHLGGGIAAWKAESLPIVKKD